MSDNAFMASASKSKRKQKAIQMAEGGDEFVVISLRIMKSTHRKIMKHKFETGENMTTLINRLLEKELG